MFEYINEINNFHLLRPVEEVMYAYAWMRNNFGLLGTTGENVFFVGDSAGGNLVTGLTSRCIELNIPGPKALLLFYPSMLAQARGNIVPDCT